MFCYDFHNQGFIMIKNTKISKLEKAIIGTLLTMSICCTFLVGTVINTYNYNKDVNTQINRMVSEVNDEVSVKTGTSKVNAVTLENLNVSTTKADTNKSNEISTNYKIQNLSTESDEYYVPLMGYDYLGIYLHYQGSKRTVEVWKNITGEWEIHGGYTLMY